MWQSALAATQLWHGIASIALHLMRRPLQKLHARFARFVRIGGIVTNIPPVSSVD
jgi:hypothetical protein